MEQVRGRVDSARQLFTKQEIRYHQDKAHQRPFVALRYFLRDFMQTDRQTESKA